MHIELQSQLIFTHCVLDEASGEKYLWHAKDSTESKRKQRPPVLSNKEKFLNSAQSFWEQCGSLEILSSVSCLVRCALVLHKAQLIFNIVGALTIPQQLCVASLAELIWQIQGVPKKLCIEIWKKG